jgi:NitT/TauT family transport system substrate-binding protein
LDKGIACSSNTIIEYVTFQMLQDFGVPLEDFKIIETKNIPIRLQMLLSNQVQLATLPEPLVSLAVMKGAEVIIDDAGKDFSLTILAFRDDFLKREPAAVRRFLKAHNKAADTIYQDPEKIRPIMNRFCRIPLPLQEGMRVPRFPPLEMPGEEQINQIYSWLREKRIIKRDLAFNEMVADGFLP